MDVETYSEALLKPWGYSGDQGIDEISLLAALGTCMRRSSAFRVRASGRRLSHHSTDVQRFACIAAPAHTSWKLEYEDSQRDSCSGRRSFPWDPGVVEEAAREPYVPFPGLTDPAILFFPHEIPVWGGVDKREFNPVRVWRIADRFIRIESWSEEDVVADLIVDSRLHIGVYHSTRHASFRYQAMWLDHAERLTNPRNCPQEYSYTDAPAPEWDR